MKTGKLYDTHESTISFGAILAGLFLFAGAVVLVVALTML